MKGVLVIAALVAVSVGALPNGCSKELSTTLLPDFKHCARFWKCTDGVPILQSCPERLHFSTRLQRCTLPVFARCRATDGDATLHNTFASSILDTLHNVVSRKAPVEDEFPAPPYLPSGDLPNEEDTFRRFPDAEADVTELKEDEAVSDEEECQEKVNETSEVEDVVSENSGASRQQSMKAVTVVNEKDEEEEDEKKKRSKGDKSIKKESKKSKSVEKEKDSGSDAESEDEE